MANHYDYLDREWVPFYHRVCEMEGIKINDHINNGMIIAHTDKCYQCATMWNNHDVPFERGVAIYLLTYIMPWAGQVRDRADGWAAPANWVVENYQRFLPCFPPT
jgi:hypothetical protein